MGITGGGPRRHDRMIAPSRRNWNSRVSTSAELTASLQRRSRMLAPESILAWIVIGAIAGWLAGILVKGYGHGLFGNIVIGILGAGVAGLLAPRIGLHTESFGSNI